MPVISIRLCPTHARSVPAHITEHTTRDATSDAARAQFHDVVMPAMQVALAVCGCFILTVCLSVAAARRYAPVRQPGEAGERLVP